MALRISNLWLQLQHGSALAGLEYGLQETHKRNEQKQKKASQTTAHHGSTLLQRAAAHRRTSLLVKKLNYASLFPLLERLSLLAVLASSATLASPLVPCAPRKPVPRHRPLVVVPQVRGCGAACCATARRRPRPHATRRQRVACAACSW